VHQPDADLRSRAAAIVTDSSACLPPDIVERYGVAVVPLALLFDGDLLHDGQIDSAAFYRRLESARRTPTTTSPAPGEILDAFRRARDAGAPAVLCLTLAAQYSGAYSAARTAADLAARELPGFRVEVRETGALAMSHGFAVLQAAKALHAGAGIEEAIEAAEAVSRRARLIGVMETMRYLVKSGRVPWVVGWGASLLSIKPILAAAGGRVHSISRARSTGRALGVLLRYLARHAGEPAALHVGVVHANAAARAQELATHIQTTLQPRELLVAEFTTVMAVHTGPGFVGLAFYSAGGLREYPALHAESLLQRDVAVLEPAIPPPPAPVSDPVLVTLSGLPGSGKSFLARRIVARRPLAVVESDHLRRVLFHAPTHSRPESTRLFAAIHELLDRLLSRGVPTLLDATNLKEEHRRILYGIAGKNNARLVIVQTRAPEGVIRRRLRARAAGRDPHDRSQADIQTYRRLRAEAEPIQREHLVVDTTGDIEQAVEGVLRKIESAWV
jgi:DegV family protein with EDD domain